MAFTKPVFEKTLAGKIDAGTAVFSAIISGNPWPDIKWSVNDELIDPSSERFKIQQNAETGEISMTVEKVAEIGSASYMCELSNRLGSVSKKININLGGSTPSGPKKTASGEDIIPPTFEIPLKPKIEKTTGTFSCKVAGYPRPTVKWFIDNEEAEDDEIHQISYLEDGTATMIVPDLTDIGTASYRCEISNEGGTVKSGKFDLKVPKKDDNQKPKFLQQIKPQVFDQHAIFEAKVTGKPMPKIQWFVNEEEITENTDNFTMETDEATGITKLDIANISKVGPAKYVCKISNASGTASSIVTIGGESQPKSDANENDKPKFIEQMKHSVQKTDLLLTAKISGNPLPFVEWYVNGQLAVDDGGENFTLSYNEDGNISVLVINFRKYGNTEYKCVIFNKRGSAKNRLEITLNPNDPPAPKTADPDFSSKRPKFIEPLTPLITDRSVQVQGRVTGQPLPNLSWTVNEEEITYDDDRFSLEYQSDGSIVFLFRNPSLYSGSKVAIVCVAFNDKGETTSRVQIDLTNFKGGPQDPKSEEKPNLLSKPISSGLKNGRQYFDFQVKSKPMTVEFFVDDQPYSTEHREFFKLDFVVETLTAYGECIKQPRNCTQVVIKVVVTIRGVCQECSHTFKFTPLPEKDEEPKVEKARFTSQLTVIERRPKRCVMTATFVASPKPEVLMYIDSKPVTDIRYEVTTTQITIYIELIKYRRKVLVIELVNPGGKGRSECPIEFEEEPEDEPVEDEVQPEEEKPRLQKRKLPDGAAKVAEPMKLALPDDDVIEFVIEFEGTRPTSKWTIDGKSPSLNRDATVTTKENTAILKLKNKDKYINSEINFIVENNLATANNTFAIKNNRPVVSESVLDKTIKKKSPLDEAPKIVSKFTIRRVKTVSIIEGKIGGRPTPTFTWYNNKRPIDPKDPDFKQTSKPDGTVSIEIPDKETDKGLDLILVAENYLGAIEVSFVLLSDSPTDLSFLDPTQLLMLFLSDPNLRELLEELVAPYTRRPKKPVTGKPQPEDEEVDEDETPAEEAKVHESARPDDKKKPKDEKKPEEKPITDEDQKPEESKPKYTRRPKPKPVVPKEGVEIARPIEPVTTDDNTVTFVVEFEGPNPKTTWTIDGKNPRLNRDATVDVKDNKATLTLKNKDKYLKSDIKFTVENDKSQANNTFTVKQNRPIVSDAFLDKTTKKKSPLDEAPKILTPFTIKRVRTTSVIEGKIGGRPTPTITWFVHGQPLDPKDPVFKQNKKPDGTITLEVPDSETENGLEIIVIAENYLGTLDYSFVLMADKPKSLDLESVLEALLLLADPELIKNLVSSPKPVEEYPVDEEPDEAKEKPEDQKSQPKDKKEPEPSKKPIEEEPEKPKDKDEDKKPKLDSKKPQEEKKPETKKPSDSGKDDKDKPKEPGKLEQKPADEDTDKPKPRFPLKKKPVEKKPDDKDKESTQLFDTPGSVKLKPAKKKVVDEPEEPEETNLKPFRRGSKAQPSDKDKEPEGRRPSIQKKDPLDKKPDDSQKPLGRKPTDSDEEIVDDDLEKSELKKQETAPSLRKDLPVDKSDKPKGTPKDDKEAPKEPGKLEKKQPVEEEPDKSKPRFPLKKKPVEKKPDEKESTQLYDTPGSVKLKPAKKRVDEPEEPEETTLKPLRRGSKAQPSDKEPTDRKPSVPKKEPIGKMPDDGRKPLNRKPTDSDDEIVDDDELEMTEVKTIESARMFADEFPEEPSDKQKEPGVKKPKETQPRQAKPSEKKPTEPKLKKPDDPGKSRPIDRQEVPKGGAVITKPIEPVVTSDDKIVLKVAFDGDKPKTLWTVDGKNPKMIKDAVEDVKDNIATLTLKGKDKYIKSDIKFTVENDTAQSNNTFTVKEKRPVVSDTFVDKTVKKKSPTDEEPKIVTPFTIKRVKNTSVIEGKVGGRPTPTITWKVRDEPVDPKSPVFKQTKKPDGTVVFEVPDKETENGLEIVFVAENYVGSVDFHFVLMADKPKDLQVDSSTLSMLLVADPELKDTLDNFELDESPKEPFYEEEVDEDETMQLEVKEIESSVPFLDPDKVAEAKKPEDKPKPGKKPEKKPEEKKPDDKKPKKDEPDDSKPSKEKPKEPEEPTKGRPIDRKDVPEGAAVITKPLEPEVTKDDTVVFKVEFDGDKPKTLWTVDGKNPKLNRDATVDVKDKVATLTLKNKDKYINSDIKFTVENDTAQSDNIFSVKQNRPVLADTFVDKSVKKKSPLDESPKIITPFTIKRIRNVSVIEGKIGGRPTPTITWIVRGEPVDPKDPVFKQSKKPDGTVVLEVPDNETENGLEIIFTAENYVGAVDYTFVLTADKPQSLDLDSTLEALLLLADPELLKTLLVSKPKEETVAYDSPEEVDEEFKPEEEPEAQSKPKDKTKKPKPTDDTKDEPAGEEPEEPKDVEETQAPRKPKKPETSKAPDEPEETDEPIEEAKQKDLKTPQKPKEPEKPKDSKKPTKPGKGSDEPEEEDEPIEESKQKGLEKPRDQSKPKEPGKTKEPAQPGKPKEVSKGKAPETDKDTTEKTTEGKKPEDAEANKPKFPLKKKPPPKPDEKDSQKKELFDSPGAVKLKPPKRRPSQTDDPNKVELKPFDKRKGSIAEDDSTRRASIDKRRPSDVSKTEAPKRPSTAGDIPEDEDEEVEEEVAPTSEKVAHSAPKQEPEKSKFNFISSMSVFIGLQGRAF